MNENELVERLSIDVQKEIEFEIFQGASAELIEFLTKYVPNEELEEMLELLHAYSNAAGDLAQKMMVLAEKLAEKE